VTEREKCGSSSCLVDGLKEAIDKQGEVLRLQHLESRDFMRDLMTVHVGHLTSQIVKTNSTLEEHTKNLYPMLRDVQTRMTKIETEIGPQGIDIKIKDAINDAEVVKWVSNRRRTENSFFVRMGTVLAVAAVLAALGMYVDYAVRTKPMTPTKQGEAR